MPSGKMHRLLKRQLKRSFGESFKVPQEWSSFIDMVNNAYHESDSDRNMLERSMELSSQELLQTNSEMRAIFEAVPDIFFRIDASGKILDCKTGNTSDLFVSRQEMIGKLIYDIPLTRVAFKFRKAMEAVRKKNAAVSFEYSLLLHETENFYEARLIPLLEDQAIVIIRNITDLKDAESALQKSEEIHTRLVDTIPDVIIRTNLEGKILFINNHTITISGYKRDEVEGKNILEFIAPEDHVRAMKNNILMMNNKPGPKEYQFIMKDRRKVPFEVNGDVLRNEDNTPFGMVHVCRDITERKQTEEALRENEKRFRLITDNVHDTVWLMDMNLQTTWISPSVEQTRGFTLEELQSLPMERHLTPQSLEVVIGLIETNLSPERLANHREDISVNAEIEFYRKDSSTMWADTVITLLRDGQGIPTGFLGVSRDTTERRKMEEAIRESENKYRLLTERITDIVWIADMNLRELYVSPSIEKVLGFTQEERLQQPFYQQLTPASLSFAMETMARELDLEKQGNADPNRKVILELEYYHKDGSTRWIETNITSIRNDQGVMMELHGVSRDITKRKRAEEALKTAHAELEQRVAERTYELTAANTNLKELFQKQDVNIDLAKNILAMINYRPSRHSFIQNNIDLFFTAYYLPCYAEGGDHYFVKNLSERYPGINKTAISLKDQSGHEVSCILRSIITDLIHNALLINTPGFSLEETITQLNREICELPFFGEDNFFTAINAEINHENMTMRYVSAGHPPFVLIRNQDIVCLPSLDSQGRNLPVGVHQTVDFMGEEIKLQKGDKLIFFTDGLTDIPYKKGRHVLNAEDMKDLIASIVRDEPHLPVSILMARLFNRINGQAGDNVVVSHSFDDDVTLLGLELENESYEHEDIVRPENLEDFDRCVNNLFQKISAEWEEKGFPSPESRLRMVLEEAMVNAWSHGNHEDPQKMIVIRRRYGNDAVLEVIDEGDGFNFKTFYDPTSKENLLKPRGRGNFIMRLLTEETQWKDGGRHLVSYFSREDKSEHTFRSFPGLNLWRRSKKDG